MVGLLNGSGSSTLGNCFRCEQSFHKHLKIPVVPFDSVSDALHDDACAVISIRSATLFPFLVVCHGVFTPCGISQITIPVPDKSFESGVRRWRV